MSWFGRRTRGSATPPADAIPLVEPGASTTRYPRGALILAGLGGATLTALGLWALQSFFAPFFLALVLTICVHPLRARLEREGVTRSLATGSVIAAVFLLLAAFVTALVVAFAQFANLLPQFAPQIREIGQAVSDALTRVGFDQDQAQSIVTSLDPGRIMSFLSGLLGSVTTIAVGLIVVLTTLILMAVDASFLTTVLRELAPARPGMVAALETFASGVRKYMIATTGLGVAQGALNWVALLVLQVPGAFLWGLLAFLCSFIPNIGYFIAIVPPLVFGYFVGGWPTVVAVVVVYGVVNAVVQSLIQPRIVGNAVALSQTITFVSVLFWATVIGPIGAILAIPLTLLVRAILVDSDPETRWWRPVLGDLAETKIHMKNDDEAAKSKRRSTTDAHDERRQG
ncbi:AI-2E family transporter [Conyzicola sp.]|uniref:AI-2E family transporter n=1 Tax=Conyzicola sp. TaxID=1969404 RepID=UPI003989E3AF